MSDLQIVPVTWGDSCGFVEMWHRHHRAPIGHKFCIAIIGRPSARAYQDGRTLEVTRTATDGTPNANSMLYGAAWRAAKALGYLRLITYTQDGETGASLRAAAYRVVAQRPARKGWDTPSRPRESRGVEGIPRTLWEVSA